MSFTGLQTDIINTIQKPHVYNKDEIIFNQEGIDTITLTANYQTVINIIHRKTLSVQHDVSNLPITPYLKTIEKQLSRDDKKRYKKEQHQPIIEYVKISKGTGLSTYMIIVKNTPYLFDYAINNKKSKSHYCQVIFTGLHQPTKKISSESIKFISKIVRRKMFKLHSVDIAIDYLEKGHINYKKKEQLKKQLELYYHDSHIIKGSSFYLNDTNYKFLDRVLIYDKYNKQKKHQKQNLDNSLEKWKRLEVTIKPTDKTNFLDFVNSGDFIECRDTIKDISKRVKVSGLDSSYLNYQINSLIDNRIMNNTPSKKQFNALESVNRFNSSDFRRFTVI